MRGDLLRLKSRAVPSSLDAQRKKSGYRETVTVDLEGALNAERCVDVRSVGIAGANHYDSEFNPPYHHRIPGAIAGLYVRRSVATRLRDINASLAALGLEVYLFDAWRPQAVQRYFHGDWFPKWLSARRPDLTGAALAEEVANYWAKPSDGPGSPSPHSTGGAVDLTLIHSDTQQPLFMGGIFDDVTSIAWTDAFEQSAPGSMSEEEARANRRLLYWVMSEAGFANNPTEWWHYSWGDQMWAKLTGQPAAVYGGCDPVGQA
jgi:D-alanyl-D-alanine dipeptidase